MHYRLTSAIVTRVHIPLCDQGSMARIREIRIVAYGLTHKSPVITSLDTRFALEMERTMGISATGQNSQGSELPEWVREAESIIPRSAVRATTSKDYNARVSIVCFKDKEELVMDALKNHGAGAKRRSTDGKERESIGLVNTAWLMIVLAAARKKQCVFTDTIPFANHLQQD